MSVPLPDTAMRLPFTVEQFYATFRDYNEAVWPAQWLLFGLAVVATVLAFVPRRWSWKIVSGILACLWIWQAVAYHFAFFARINPLAYAFGVISLMAGWMFIWDGVILGRLRFYVRNRPSTYAGFALIAFALFVYPAWSWYAGARYPGLPTFGLPCPTTIFTIGMLSLRAAPYPRGPLFVPILWTLVGGQAAFLLDVPQDLGLVAAGAIGLVLLTQRRVHGALRTAS
jgi:hypothetical protein